jgi:hypothetical protein
MNLEHRAAISLNNIGVALLQRRCYQQGFRTLRDAVEAMTSAASRRTQQRSGSTEGGYSSSRETPCEEVMLHQAAKRLANPEPSVDRNAASQYDLHVLSECEHPAVLLDHPPHSVSTPSPSLLHHHTITPLTAPRADFNDKRAYLLRIEALNYEASAERNYDVQSSIILQNFGIAYLYMADMTDAASTDIHVQLGAMHIFTKSYSVLMASCQSHLNGNYLEDTELQRFCLLASLILQNLVELSTLLGLHQHVLEYNSCLENIQNSARDMQDWSQKGFAAGAA